MTMETRNQLEIHGVFSLTHKDAAHVALALLASTLLDRQR
jgi:hypothetical protein